MRNFNFFTLIGVILSINTLGGILFPAIALEQPIDNNQTGITVEQLLKGNLTSNLDSNLSNATTPAEYR